MQTYIKTFTEDNPQNYQLVKDRAEIVELLKKAGIVLEQWQAEAPLSEQATPEEVMAAYAKDIERLKIEKGYDTIDVVSISPNTPNHDQARLKFLAEHTHDDDEVRYFVDGTGAFYIRHDGQVHALMCTKGDLINLPAGTKHWFDMGSSPAFKAIRFFKVPEGWVGNFTGDKIADRFPKYEQLV